jgi:hypothetical protein
MNYRSFLFLILLFSSCVQYTNGGSDAAVAAPAYKENLWPKEDEFYSVFYPENLFPELRNIRPMPSDTSIQFCIPVAFTKLENDSIDGLFIANGKVFNRFAVNHTLGGGMLIRGKEISIFKTDGGKLLTTNWMDSIANLKQSFFQQIQLVRNNQALELRKDQKLFQRRAIVIFNGGKIAVIESKNAITLQEFADDLVKLKVWDAIYTDMGSFDEGWYRDQTSKAIVKMGKNRSETARQSNWLIFKR